jgi:hypothetical protein
MLILLPDGTMQRQVTRRSSVMSLKALSILMPLIGLVATLTVVLLSF